MAGRFLRAALLVALTDFLKFFLTGVVGIGGLGDFPASPLFQGLTFGVVLECAISLKYKDCAGVSYFRPGSIIRDRSFPLLLVWTSLEDVICTVFLGVESGVLPTLVFGVMENSLTSPESLKLDSYSPSEQPKCCTGVGTARNGTSSEVGFC